MVLRSLFFIFLYLPFEHGEAMADQDLSVALFEGLRREGVVVLSGVGGDEVVMEQAGLARASLSCRPQAGCAGQARA